MCGAADDVASFDERHVGAERRRDGGTRVPRGTGADDHHAGRWHPARVGVEVSAHLGRGARNLRRCRSCVIDPLTGEVVLLAPGAVGASAHHDRAPCGADADAAVATCPFCRRSPRPRRPPEVARGGGRCAERAGLADPGVPQLLYPVVGGPDAGPGATRRTRVVVLSPDHWRGNSPALDDQAVVGRVGQVLTRPLSPRAPRQAGHAHVQVVSERGSGAAEATSIAHPLPLQILARWTCSSPRPVEAAVAPVTTDRVLEDHAAARGRGGRGPWRAGQAAAWCALRFERTGFEVRVAALRGRPGVRGCLRHRGPRRHRIHAARDVRRTPRGRPGRPALQRRRLRRADGCHDLVPLVGARRPG